MSIRPHPTRGNGWWHLDYYPQGKKGPRRRIPFQGTEEEARIAEAELRREARKDPLGPSPTIERAYPEFILSYSVDHQPSGVQRTIYSFKRLLPFFGKLTMAGIRSQDIENYKAARLKEVSASTVNKELAALSAMIRWGEERGFCHGVKIKRLPQKLARAPIPSIPTREEVLAFIDALRWPAQGLVACMYWAGLRKSEACSMRIEDIDTARWVAIVTGKGNKQRVVPICHHLRKIITRRLEEIQSRSGLLWSREDGRPYGDLREIFHWGLKRAKITSRITPHILRHAFGAHATEAGVGLRTLQEIMGHSTSTVTEIYTRIAAEHIARDLEKFSTVDNKKQEK